MAAQISSNQQLTNLFDGFQQKNEESSYNIKKILQVSKTLQPAHNGVKDLSQFIGFRQLLRDELKEYKKLQELSEKVSAFAESIKQTMMTHQNELESACYTLHKAEGKTGLGDFFPSFESHHLRQELDYQKQFRVRTKKPVYEEDNSLLTQPLADIALYSHVDKAQDSDRHASISPQTSEENFEAEVVTHLDKDFSIRISNAVSDNNTSIEILTPPRVETTEHQANDLVN